MPDGSAGMVVSNAATKSVVQELLEAQQRMEARRANFDQLWQECGELILPRFQNFTTRKTPGESLVERIYDSTAQLACERFSAAMESVLTPRTQRWHRVGLRSLRGKQPSKAVAVYQDDVTDCLFGNRYAPGSMFASATFNSYSALGAFGNQALETIDEVGERISYRSWDPAELYFEEDAAGRVVKVHRKYKLTLEQIVGVREWQDSLPADVRSKAAANPQEEMALLRCYWPNAQRGPNAMTWRQFPIRSYDVLIGARCILSEGGYRTMPVAVSRFNVAPGEWYGRGPGMMALPDVKMLQEMYRGLLRAVQMALDGPLLAYGEGFLRPVSMRGNAINWGTLDSQGRELLKKLHLEGQVEWTVEQLMDVRERINSAFYVKLFQFQLEKQEGPMTATEAILRNQERAALLAPVMGRQLSEMLGPVIERELDILGTAGALPEPPEELLEEAERSGGIELEIEYTSPLARLQRSDEAAGILRTVEVAQALIPLDKNVAYVLDAPAALRAIAEIAGTPAKVMRSVEDAAAMAEQAGQIEQAAQAAQLAEVAGGAAEKFANVQQTASQGSPAVPV